MKLNTSRDCLTLACAKLGGIALDQSCDISALDSKPVRVPPQLGSAGILWLVHRNGLKLDHLRELIIEQGYLSEDADINDLLEALDCELRTEQPMYFSAWADLDYICHRPEIEPSLTDYILDLIPQFV